MKSLRITTIVFTVMLAVIPAAAAAVSFTELFDSLSDTELMQAYEALQNELLSRGLAAEADGASDQNDIMVWIPSSGSKYHSKSTCSNMADPKHVSLSTAQKAGFEPCKRCKPPS